jgi:hypothetical protein
LEKNLNVKDLKQELGFVRFYGSIFVVIALAFYAGYEYADKRNNLLTEEIKVLESSVDNLRLENQQLSSQLNVKKVELEVASIANEQAQLNRKESLLREKELKEQISFYQKVMAPEMTQDGFVVESVEVLPTLSDRNYAINIMMLQRENIKSVIKGTLKIQLRGSLNGLPQTYDLVTLLDDKESKLNYSFRYFQVLEARVTLPDGFQAESLEIKTDVYKYKKRRGSYFTDVAWADALSVEE